MQQRSRQPWYLTHVCVRVCVRVTVPLWVTVSRIWLGSLTSTSYRYAHDQGILHVLLNEAKLSTFIVLSIPYLAFGRCQCTSMFYDAISHASEGVHK